LIVDRLGRGRDAQGDIERKEKLVTGFEVTNLFVHGGYSKKKTRRRAGEAGRGKGGGVAEFPVGEEWQHGSGVVRDSCR
jgi:hypothetical protein